MTQMPTDQYVFDDVPDRTVRFQRYDQVFMDEPLELLCRAARRQDEAFRASITALLNNSWMRPLTFERDAEILREGRFDFVYDRKTGLIFRCLASRHGATMTHLYNIHTGQFDADSMLIDDGEKGTLYLEQGFGAYLSSMDVQRGRKHLRCSERFEDTMTPREIQCFETFDVRRP